VIQRRTLPMTELEPNKADILGRAEIERLVNRFYEKVRADDALGPIFDEVAHVNWDEHLPKLYAFWESVLFGTGGFRGNPLAAHIKLASEIPMDWPKFLRWLEYFNSTVDELFLGENALRIKRSAHDMAHVIYSKINNVVDPRFDPANLTPEQRARYTKYRPEAPERPQVPV
jgi:hemoglobin